MQEGLLIVEAIKPGGPCDGVGIAMGDAIRFIDDYKVSFSLPPSIPPPPLSPPFSLSLPMIIRSLSFPTTLFSPFPPLPILLRFTDD